jgi:hypothetical protein
VTKWCTRLFEINREDWTVPRLRINVEVPNEYRPRIDELLQKCYAKHNGHLTFSVELPHRPRTYGPKKQSPDDPGFQSNHLHGHLSQLAIHFSYTMNEMKEIMKDDVPEWPVEPRTIGKRVKMRPMSEADVSVEVESKAIEWCHMIAGEEGIVLKEGSTQEAIHVREEV